MFLAHLPAGYLLGRAVLRRAPDIRGVWILGAAMVGGVFPDLDLLYLMLLDPTPQPHHTYWTHLPVACLGIGLFAAVASRHRSRAFRLGLLAFMLAWLSHLVLDSFVGEIGWLHPLRDEPFSLTHIEAFPRPAWTGFVLRGTVLVELACLAAAAWVEIRSPRILTRFRFAKSLAAFGLVIAALLLREAYFPGEPLAQPVLGASAKDWHPDSFWHPHWGASGVHKGIDIFARRGTPVLSPAGGLIVYRGTLKQGGNVILVLTPRGWLHYFAHLDQTSARAGSWVARCESLGRVGSSGNAIGKPPHLHYTIFSPIPRFQGFRPVGQGWVRGFYRDPSSLLSPGRPGFSGHPQGMNTTCVASDG